MKMRDGSDELRAAQERARRTTPTRWAMSKDSRGVVRDGVDEKATVQEADPTEKRAVLVRLGVEVPLGASDDWIAGAYAAAVRGEK